MSDDEFHELYDAVLDAIQQAQAADSPAEKARWAQIAREDYQDVLRHQHHFSEAQLKRLARRMSSLEN